MRFRVEAPVVGGLMSIWAALWIMGALSCPELNFIAGLVLIALGATLYAVSGSQATLGEPKTKLIPGHRYTVVSKPVKRMVGQKEHFLVFLRRATKPTEGCKEEEVLAYNLHLRDILLEMDTLNVGDSFDYQKDVVPKIEPRRI